MGSYSTNLKFYKPAATEFVDVETHLNSNWRIADTAVKRLLEYEYTDVQSPDIAGSVDRARFYSSYSNSVMAYIRSFGYFYQDPTAFVSSWVRVSTLGVGFFEHPDFPLYYRIIRKATSPVTAEIEWTGAVWNNGNAQTLNGNETGVITLPAIAIPTVSKYFMVNSGNTSTNYSIARLGFFAGSSDVQYKRYGVDPGSLPSDEARVELTGIKYNIEVAA